MKVLVPVFVVALIVVPCIVAIWRVTRASQAREDRAERRRHENFLNRLRRRALEDSAVDPTSAVFADEIGNHLANKETPR